MPKQNSFLLCISVKTIANAAVEKQIKYSNAKMQMQRTSVNQVIFN